MKKILFTSTALAAMAIGGVASAQGISLFGDARLGLGYNIYNNGDLRVEDSEDDGVLEFDTPDDLRAFSRVRFGVNMSGVTDSGITFGATIRADNSGGGQGGANGQTAGNVFVSGDWGTLTFGDTDGADAFFVGDLNEVGLTCLTCQNETPFISNGGGFGDESNNFAVNPQARPTVRYNIDIAGFGLALSTNRDLTDIGVGAGYNGDFGDASFSIGVGYYDFSEFTAFPSPDDPTAGFTTFDSGDQWSAAIGGELGMFNGKVIYTSIDFDGGQSADWGGISFGAGFDAWTVDAYYAQIFKAEGLVDDDGDFSDDIEGLQSYGVGVTYDLGGGARAEGGVASVMSTGQREDGYIVADFGIGMSF